MLATGALLMIGAVSCTSDEPANSPVAQKDEVRYLRVNITNPAGTRAIEFEAGTDAENNVGTIIFDFYDADKKFVCRANPSDITWKENTGTPVPNVGEKGEAIVKVGINQNQKYPSYVMCYINPVAWTNGSDVTMTELRTEKRANYKNANGNFAMNNSCYYGTDPISGENNVKLSGTPITTGQLFNTYEEASNATAGEIADIYVERYASKVKFTLLEDVIKSYTGGLEENSTNYSLTFVPEAWTINADEPNMYAVKNFSASATSTSAATSAEVNDMLRPWNSWNDVDNHRSYWSCSPAFFAIDFPQVSDQIFDAYQTSSNKVAGNTTGAGVAVNPFSLKYYSYNQIKTGNDVTGSPLGTTTFAASADGTLPFRYTLENTMGANAFKSANPKAAVPSVLVVGHYNMTYAGATVPENTNFYILEDKVYFDGSVTGITDAPQIKDEFIRTQQILYIKNPDSSAEQEYVPVRKDNSATALLNNLEVVHPDKAVRTAGSVADFVQERFVTLQLKDATQEVYYRPGGGGNYERVTAANIVQVNYALWKQNSVASAYTQGKCYFSIPINHLRWTEDEPEAGAAGSPLDNNGNLVWSNLRIGDMGLVRNHVYTLNVSEVKGLATGINNLDYPLVPPADQDSYYIKYRINILNWRFVPKQDNIIL